MGFRNRIIQFILEMEFHVTSKYWHLGKMRFFPNAFKSSEISVGEDDFGRINSSHERAEREPNKTDPQIHSSDLESS